MIGEEGIRRFLSIVAMAGLALGKPLELIKSSIIRARFCEFLGGASNRSHDPPELFTMGLFSMIDAILDMSMEDVLKDLPLSGDIKNALLGNESPIKEYLDLVLAYEQGRWDHVKTLSRSLGIREKSLPKYYADAIQWADSISPDQ
jgi:EAL and modified HD-GYP domain-containing signal transduction protein